MRGYKRLILLLILLPLLVWAEQICTDFSPKPEVVEIVTAETPTVDPDIKPMANVAEESKNDLDKE